MWCIIRQYRALTRHPGIHKEIKRLFMSKSFACEEVWEKRLKSPILQKVSLEDLYYELDNKFDQTAKASAIDIDIFVNAVNSEEHIDEMEDLVHKFRLSSEAANIFDSTHHAFIRNYLKYGDSNELMRILNDRLNYGIFPDDYCSVLLMNHFIQTNDFKNAAKVATFHMLQEDFNSEIIQYLSLYSCHKYLLNPTEWEKKEEEPTDIDDEEVRVRVKYIRNPFNDEHFDLKDPNQLIGKTLLMITSSLKDPFCVSYSFLGLLLSDKLKEADIAIKSCLNDNKAIYQDIIDIAENILEKKLTEHVEIENTDKDSVNNLKSGLELMKKQSLSIQDNILDIIEEKIRSIVAVSEDPIVQKQCQMYEEWENVRETSLRNELEELNKEEKILEIEKIKQELHKKEEELFFFEKENELELTIDKKKVRYPPKWPGKKKKKRNVDEAYVPPEITKKYSKGL